MENNEYGREIAGKLASIDSKMVSLIAEVTIHRSETLIESTSQRRETTKLMLAMLGIIAATVGMKIVGSPVIVDISVFASWLAVVFVTGITIYRWRDMHWGRRLTRVALVALILFSVGVRTFVYKAGVEVAPAWFPFGIDVLFTVLAITLVWSTWKSDRIAPIKCGPDTKIEQLEKRINKLENGKDKAVCG